MEAKMIYYSKIMNILEKLKKVPQRGDYHPEGDVHTHTGIVFGRLNSFYNNPTLLAAAIFHDFGKLDTTEFNKDKGYYTSYGHEIASLHYIQKFREEIEEFGATYNDVLWLVEHHMHAHFYVDNQIKDQKLIFELENHHQFENLLLFEKADSMLKDFDGEIIC